MVSKYLIPATLTALLLGCGKSDNQNLDTRTQSYQDKTLEAANKAIKSEDYKAAISLLQGYTTNNSKVLAERSFLLGEATIKSISKSYLMALWAPSQTGGRSPRLNNEYNEAVKDFQAKHETAKSYFRTAIELNPYLENKLNEIYLSDNRKLRKGDLFEPKSISLLRDYRTTYMANSADVLKLVELDFDRNKLVQDKLSELDREYEERKSNLAPIRLPRGMEVGLERRDPKRYAREKNRQAAEIFQNEMESAKILERELPKLEEEFATKKKEVMNASFFELIKPELEKSYSLKWLDENDEVVILNANHESAEFLTIELSGRPELHIVKIKVSEKGKLKPFIGKK